MSIEPVWNLQLSPSLAWPMIMALNPLHHVTRANLAIPQNHLSILSSPWITPQILSQPSWFHWKTVPKPEQRHMQVVHPYSWDRSYGWDESSTNAQNGNFGWICTQWYGATSQPSPLTFFWTVVEYHRSLYVTQQKMQCASYWKRWEFCLQLIKCSHGKAKSSFCPRFLLSS